MKSFPISSIFTGELNPNPIATLLSWLLIFSISGLEPWDSHMKRSHSSVPMMVNGILWVIPEIGPKCVHDVNDISFYRRGMKVRAGEL